VHRKKLPSFDRFARSPEEAAVTGLAPTTGQSVGKVVGDIGQAASSPERPSVPLDLGRYGRHPSDRLSSAARTDAPTATRPSRRGQFLDPPPCWQHRLVAHLNGCRRDRG